MSEQAQIGILEEFRVEFQDGWTRLPNKALFFTLLGAWLALFHFLGNSTFGYVDTPSLFGWMLNAYRGADWEEGHGAIMPVVVLALLWLRRKELLAQPLAVWWPGLLVFAPALALHVAGYLVQQPRVSIVALFVGIYALTGIAWGLRFMRLSFAPFLFFIFCLPLGSLAEPVTFPMRLFAASVSAEIGQLLGFDVTNVGTKIFDPQWPGPFEVAPACSGIRGFVALLALTAIYGFLCFKSGWRRLLLVLSSFPLAILGNVLRVTFATVVAEIFGFNAGQAVEQKAGFATFALALGGVILIERWLREPGPIPPVPEGKSP